MEHYNKFAIDDCFGKKLTSFTVPKGKVEEFVVESDVPLAYRQTVQMSQPWFFFLLKKYASPNVYARVDRTLAHRGDAFFYLRYN